MNSHSLHRLTKQELIKLILTIMLWVNIFFTLFPAHRGSILWNILPDIEAYNNIWIKSLTFLNFGFSILVIILERKIKKNIIITFFVLLMLILIISKIISYHIDDFISIIAIPIEYLSIYVIIKNYSFSKRTLNLVKIILSLWVIIPVILLLVGPIETKLSFLPFDKNGNLDTFGGFAFHRNYFGYYSGLIILLVILGKGSAWLKLIIISFGILGIFASTSRSTFLCLIIAIVAYVWMCQKKYRLPFCIGIICIVFTYYFLSIEFQYRKGDITQTSDREELIEAFGDSISDHPILGNGTITMVYSSTYPNGAQAHNFILQTWCDYGIFGLICFLLFWGAIFYYGNKIVKIFLLYLISFGLFQPYFMLNIPSPFIWMNILFICLVGGENKLHIPKKTIMNNILFK